LYWDHKQDLSSNPKKYPSPPYFPKRFGELDLESFSLNLEEIQRFEGSLMSRGSRKVGFCPRNH